MVGEYGDAGPAWVTLMPPLFPTTHPEPEADTPTPDEEEEEVETSKAAVAEIGENTAGRKRNMFCSYSYSGVHGTTA